MDYESVFRALHAFTAVQNFVTSEYQVVKATDKGIMVVSETEGTVFFEASEIYKSDTLVKLLNEFKYKYPVLDCDDVILTCILAHMLEAVHADVRIWYDEHNSFYAKACDEDHVISGVFYVLTADEREVAYPILYDAENDEIRMLEVAPVTATLSLRNILGKPSNTTSYQLLMAGLPMFYKHLMHPVDPVIESVNESGEGYCVIVNSVQYDVKDVSQLSMLKALLHCAPLRDMFWRLEVVPNNGTKISIISELYAVCRFIQERYNSDLEYVSFDDGITMLTLDGSSGVKRIIFDLNTQVLAFYNCKISDVDMLTEAAKRKLEEYERQSKSPVDVAKQLTYYLLSSCPDNPGEEVLRILSVQGVSNAEDVFKNFLSDIGYIK